MFNVDDYVVYQYWVSKITDITTIKNAVVGYDNHTPFYVMKSLYEKETFYVPTEGVHAIRRPMDKTQALQLIDDLPNITVLERPNDDLYRSTISHYDCYSYVKILKSVYDKTQYLNKLGKRLSIIDNKYSHLAEKYLFEELSFALDVPITDVDEFIRKRLDVK
jgi:CarD family transcriptional regulator